MSLSKLETGPELVIHWSLKVPADQAWQHLTDTERLPEWLGRFLGPADSGDAPIRVDHGDGYICESRLLLHDAEARQLELTWKFPDEHETVVKVDVSSEGDGSVLVLRHAGLADLIESYEPGWLTHLTYLEASLVGAPMTPAHFWNLYGTLRTLVRPG